MTAGAGGLVLAILLSGVAWAAPGDVKLKREEGAPGGFPVTTFPHWIHRINYRGDACHNRLFEMKAGQAEISMDDIKAGRACGTCHNGDQAFAVEFTNCERCHVPTEEESAQ